MNTDIYTSAYLLVFPSLVLLDYQLQLPLVVSRVLRADTIHFALEYWADHCCDLCIYTLDSGRELPTIDIGSSACTASFTSDQGTPPKSGRDAQSSVTPLPHPHTPLSHPHTPLSHPVTILPCMPQKRHRCDNEDNVEVLVRCACTLSKLKSNGEDDYEEEWATISHMVSADTFKFGLHPGRISQKGSHDKSPAPESLWL